MSCTNSFEIISSLIDGLGTPGDRRIALAHLETCRTCSARVQSVQRMRESLASMNRAAMPEGLTDRLRVLASHERERRLRRINLATMLRSWAEGIKFHFENMARPVALPVAGGVLCALLLLGAWAPAMVSRRSSDDVPLPAAVYASPQPRYISDVNPADEVVVVLTIDERGRVSDFAVTSGEMTPDLANMILLSRFYPATAFGQPTRGTLVYRYSYVHVTG